MAAGADEVESLRAELSRWRGLRRRYPEDLKGRALAFARKRRKAGASYDAVAAELGISVMTVWEWLKGPAGKRRLKAGKKPALLRPALLPVEVVAAKEGDPGKGGPVLVTKDGVRVEGLSIEEIAALLRGLS